VSDPYACVSSWEYTKITNFLQRIRIHAGCFRVLSYVVAQLATLGRRGVK
jgi:hypothetical protein